MPSPFANPPGGCCCGGLIFDIYHCNDSTNAGSDQSQRNYNFSRMSNFRPINPAPNFNSYKDGSPSWSIPPTKPVRQTYTVWVGGFSSAEPELAWTFEQRILTGTSGPTDYFLTCYDVDNQVELFSKPFQSTYVGGDVGWVISAPYAVSATQFVFQSIYNSSNTIPPIPGLPFGVVPYYLNTIDQSGNITSSPPFLGLGTGVYTLKILDQTIGRDPNYYPPGATPPIIGLTIHTQLTTTILPFHFAWPRGYGIRRDIQVTTIKVGTATVPDPGGGTMVVDVFGYQWAIKTQFIVGDIKVSTEDPYAGIPVQWGGGRTAKQPWQNTLTLENETVAFESNTTYCRTGQSSTTDNNNDGFNVATMGAGIIAAGWSSLGAPATFTQGQGCDGSKTNYCGVFYLSQQDPAGVGGDPSNYVTGFVTPSILDSSYYVVQDGTIVRKYIVTQGSDAGIDSIHYAAITQVVTLPVQGFSGYASITMADLLPGALLPVRSSDIPYATPSTPWKTYGLSGGTTAWVSQPTTVNLQAIACSQSYFYIVYPNSSLAVPAATFPNCAFDGTYYAFAVANDGSKSVPAGEQKSDPRQKGATGFTGIGPFASGYNSPVRRDRIPLSLANL